MIVHPSAAKILGKDFRFLQSHVYSVRGVPAVYHPQLDGVTVLYREDNIFGKSSTKKKPAAAAAAADPLAVEEDSMFGRNAAAAITFGVEEDGMLDRAAAAITFAGEEDSMLDKKPSADEVTTGGVLPDLSNTLEDSKRHSDIIGMIMEWMEDDIDNGKNPKTQVYPHVDPELKKEALVNLEDKAILEACCATMENQMTKGKNVLLKTMFPPFTDYHINKAKGILFGIEEAPSNNKEQKSVATASATASDLKESSLDSTMNSDELSVNLDIGENFFDNLDMENLLCAPVAGEGELKAIGNSCSCHIKHGKCIDRHCKNYRSGKECDDRSCHNNACLNRSVSTGTYPLHIIKFSKRRGFIMIAGENIVPGQTIAPLFGYVVSWYDLSKADTVEDIDYIPVAKTATDGVAIEFTTARSSGAFAAKTCTPNARYRIICTSNGELVPVLTATESIKEGQEVMVYAGTLHDPKSLTVRKNGVGSHVDCKCNRQNCEERIPIMASFDLSTPAVQLVGCVPSVRIEKGTFHETFFPNKQTRTPHPCVGWYTGKKCSYCSLKDRINEGDASQGSDSSNSSSKKGKKNKGVVHDPYCNMYFCSECNFDWHCDVLPQYLTAKDCNGNKLTAKDCNGNKYNLGLCSSEENGRFLRAPIDVHLKDAMMNGDWGQCDILCPQRNDVVHHAGLSQERYFQPCLLCGSFGGVRRCGLCFVDLCDLCWFSWHPNMDQHCDIVPATCCPRSVNRNAGRRMW